MGFQNIVDVNGFGIALTGMLIVFVALVLISLMIAALPRVLVVLEPYLPESEAHGHGAGGQARNTVDEEAVVAAIAYAMHQQRQAK